MPLPPRNCLISPRTSNTASAVQEFHNAFEGVRNVIGNEQVRMRLAERLVAILPKPVSIRLAIRSQQSSEHLSWIVKALTDSQKLDVDRQHVQVLEACAALEQRPYYGTAYLRSSLHLPRVGRVRSMIGGGQSPSDAPESEVSAIPFSRAIRIQRRGSPGLYLLAVEQLGIFKQSKRRAHPQSRRAHLQADLALLHLLCKCVRPYHDSLLVCSLNLSTRVFDFIQCVGRI